MLYRRYYPRGESGDVREYLEALRKNSQNRKAAVKLDIDIQTLEAFWPQTMNVSVRLLRGWEPLWELKRLFDKIAYRIFFCIRKDELWLLSVYEKASARAPRNELERAYGRMRKVLEDKA